MTVVDAQSRVAYWAAAYGIPPQIALGVASRESGFQQTARGASGEVGVMQLMPATAASLGVNAYDGEANIEGGMRLLRDEYARFGDWSYALAAYNCGAACAARGPDRWPPSTRNYVAAITGLPPVSPPPSTGITDEWGQEPAPIELESMLGADPLVLIVAAVGAFLLLWYFTD